MKRKDFTLILMIVVVSGVISLVLSSLTIGSPGDRNEQVEVVKPIASEFIQPNPDYFNESSRNPTAIIRIGDSNNFDPFSGN